MEFFRVAIDSRDLKELDEFFKKSPRAARAMVRRVLSQEGKKVRDMIRAEHLSGPTGPGRLGRSAGGRALQLKGGGRRKHVREAMVHRVKTAKHGPDHIGGYVSFKVPQKSGARHVLRFHEAGTRFHRARGMIEAARPKAEERISSALTSAVITALEREWGIS